MNKSKIESDIVILDDLLLEIESDIIKIENQLELNELTTDGNDDYFEWRTRAICAINHKRIKCGAIKRQAKFWRDKLKKISSKEKMELDASTSLKKSLDKIERQKAHFENQKDARENKLKIHQAAQEREVLISVQFKKIIKEYVGESKYIELIQKAKEIAIRDDKINKGETL